MCSYVVNDVSHAFLHKKTRLFGHEFERKAEKDILLWSLWQSTDKDSGDVVSVAEVGYVVDVVEVILFGDVGDCNGVGGAGQNFARHCTTNHDRLACSEHGLLPQMYPCCWWHCPGSFQMPARERSA